MHGDNGTKKQKLGESSLVFIHVVSLGLYYTERKRSRLLRKMIFLAERKKSYYTEKSHLKKVILSIEWFSPQKVAFILYNMEKKTIFHVKWTKMTF